MIDSQTMEDPMKTSGHAQLGSSHLAPSIRPDPGHNVPGSGSAGPEPAGAHRRSTGVAGWLLMVFAALVLANTAISALTSGATGADWSFAVLLAMVAGASARSLWLGAAWAKWTAFALAFVGLFFVLPVTATIVLGGSTDPVGTGWDVVFFPLTTGVLIALLVGLWTLRNRAV